MTVSTNCYSRHTANAIMRQAGVPHRFCVAVADWPSSLSLRRDDCDKPAPDAAGHEAAAGAQRAGSSLTAKVFQLNALHRQLTLARVSADGSEHTVTPNKSRMYTTAGRSARSAALLSVSQPRMLTPVQTLAPDEIRQIRQREHISQPVFARYLNVSKNLVSDWERGVRRPGGPALRLLTVIQKKGLQAIA